MWGKNKSWQFPKRMEGNKVNRKKKIKLRRKEEERTSVRKTGISSLLRKTAGCLPIGMRQGELRISIDWKIKIILMEKKMWLG